MSLVQRELSETKHFKEVLQFPKVVKHPDVIMYIFSSNPSIARNKYIFELYEYNKGRPILRSKKQGLWLKNHKYGFSLVSDYLVKPNKKYALKTTIYINNNVEVFDIVYIQT